MFPGKIQEMVGLSMLLAHMLTETQCWLCPGHARLSSATVCQLWKLTVFSSGKLHISVTSESCGICRALMKQLLVEDKSGNCVIRQKLQPIILVQLFIRFAGATCGWSVIICSGTVGESRRGCTGRDLNVKTLTMDNRRQQSSKDVSRVRQRCEGVQVTVLFYIKNKLSK